MTFSNCEIFPFRARASFSNLAMCLFCEASWCSASKRSELVDFFWQQQMISQMMVKLCKKKAPAKKRKALNEEVTKHTLFLGTSEAEVAFSKSKLSSGLLTKITSAGSVVPRNSMFLLSSVVVVGVGVVVVGVVVVVVGVVGVGVGVVVVGGFRALGSSVVDGVTKSEGLRFFFSRASILSKRVVLSHSQTKGARFGGSVASFLSSSCNLQNESCSRV